MAMGGRYMAENTVVHIGENSPEHVAYRLLHDIANVEDKILHRSRDNPGKVADRKWVLDTYAECLRATSGKRAKPLE
jgi:siderophore synthetase component